MDETIGLRKQVRLLTIAIAATLILSFVSVIEQVRQLYPGWNTSWPDLTVAKLKAKEIHLMSPDGSTRMLLSVVNGNPGTALLDSKGEVRMLSGMTSQGEPYLRLFNDKGSGGVNLGDGFIVVGNDVSHGVVITALSGDGPSVSVHDDDGYSVTVGKASVLNKVDGTRNITSAASIVASSKDSTVQWRLPTPSVQK